MAFTTGALIAGSLLGAGGQIAGGLLGQPDTFSTSNILASGFNPQADPLQNAVTIQNLINLGFPIDAVVGNASPLSQLQNAVGTGTLGFTERDEARLSNALRRAAPALEEAIERGLSPEEADRFIEAAVFEGGAGDGDKRLNIFKRALSGTGTKTIGGLFEAENNFRTAISNVSQQAGSPEAQAAQAQTLAGQQAARQRIAQIQQDFPEVTQAQIGQIEEQFRSQARERLLEQANVGNFNPAAGLSRLEADPNALASAITLLGGQGQIANQAIGALQGSLLSPLQAAQAGAATGLNAQLGAGQLASDQAQALANLSAQTNIAQNQAVGGGVAGGLGALGSGIQTLGLLNAAGAAPGVGGSAALGGALGGGGFGGLAGLLGGRI